jgi:hypothetical protein
MFAGPTLARAALDGSPRLDGLVVLPPVKRDDLPRITDAPGEPGVLIIVDGYFHLANLSVGHLEIRLAMKRGWQVWGLSSMGAIRAAEMHHLGMRGFGAVFERYRDDPDFRDDEVALLHEPSPPYREGSEPLVHLRTALADLRTRGVVDDADVAAILDELMAMWFGERSLALFRDLIVRRRPDRADEVRAWMQDFGRFRLKVRDLLTFLSERPWM